MRNLGKEGYERKISCFYVNRIRIIKMNSKASYSEIITWIVTQK